jgi:hypothetical protein
MCEDLPLSRCWDRWSARPWWCGCRRWLHLYGALLAFVVSQVLWLLFGLPAWWRSSYFRRRLLRMHFDREMTVRLATFSVMTITSALLPPLINIAVRDHLALQFGWERVGYWQAVSKVSDAYLLFLTTAINIYYLPKLASTHESRFVDTRVTQCLSVHAASRRCSGSSRFMCFRAW